MRIDSATNLRRSVPKIHKTGTVPDSQSLDLLIPRVDLLDTGERKGFFPMTAGHFGFAAGVKSQAPRVPLWALMVSTYLLDFVFIFFVAAGIESFAPLDPSRTSYGNVIIHAYYTHSLVGAVILSAIAGLLAARRWGKRAGVVIGAVVFSHWILDLIVHRPDLPILPGNLGGLPLLGFGLWNAPAASALLELLLVVVGGYLYYRAATQAPIVKEQPRSGRRRAVLAAAVTGLLMVFLLASDVFGLSLVLSLLLMLLLVFLSGWLDSRLFHGIPPRPVH
jgi:hypothetical protein